MTEDEARELLRRTTKTAGGQKAWAQQVGISPAFVSDVLRGRRDLGERIPAALGLRRVVRYERIEA